MTRSGPALIRRVTWLAIMAASAVTCLGALWNQAARGSFLRMGETLVDESRPVAPAFAWQRFRNHDYQLELQRFVALSLPLRPALVRLHNEVLFSLFGVSPVPNIVVGDGDHLVERHYVDRYCRRSLERYLPYMRRRIAELRALQDHYASQKRAFVYVITPSKMARMPEKFLGHVDCPGDAGERNAFIPAFTRMLEEAGISFVDAATLMADVQRSGITPFPVGGIHWTMLGAAHGASAIVHRLNDDAGQSVLPELRWSTWPAQTALLEDSDLVVGLNLLFERSYPSTGVSFSVAGPCPTPKPSLTAVGGSFTIQIVRALSDSGCIQNGKYLSNLTRALWTFPPMRRVAAGPLKADVIRPLLGSDILVVEENENIAGASLYVTGLLDVLSGREPTAQPAVREY